MLIDRVHVVNAGGEVLLGPFGRGLQRVDAAGLFRKQLDGVLCVEEAEEFLRQLGVLRCGGDRELLHAGHDIGLVTLVQNRCVPQAELKAVGAGRVLHFVFHPVAVRDKQRLVHHHVRLRLRVVQRDGAFHQIAVRGDLLDVLENLQHLGLGEGAFHIVLDILERIQTGGGADCRPEDGFNVAGVNALISEQRDAFLLGQIAQREEVVPGFRQLPALFGKERLVVDKAHRRGVERGKINFAVSIGGALGGLQNAVLHKLLQRRAAVQTRLIEEVGQLEQRVFLDERKQNAGLVVVVHGDKVGILAGDDLRTDDIADGRADLHVDLYAGVGRFEARDHLVPVIRAVAALENGDVQFLIFKSVGGACLCRGFLDGRLVRLGFGGRFSGGGLFRLNRSLGLLLCASGKYADEQQSSQQNRKNLFHCYLLICFQVLGTL